MKNKFFPFTLLFLCFAPSILFSQHPDVLSAIALSKKLNDLKMFDYSIYLLEQTIKDYPADADKVKIQLALTLFTQGKADEGERIIASITSSSKYFLDSRRAFGLAAILRGKYDQGINALEEYFKVKLKDPPQDEDGKNDFIEAWQYLIAAYQQKKNLKKVDEVLKYKEAIEPKEEKKGPEELQDREGKLLSIQIKLDAIEELKAEGKSGWQNTVNDYLKSLDSLKWAGVDSIFVLAEVEQVRCLYLLDRYDDALKALTKPSTAQNIASFDEAYKQMKMPSSAPSVLAALYEGMIYHAKGDKATSNEEKIALYSKALAKFFWIIDKHTAFPKLEKAITHFTACKQKLENLGKTVKLKKEFLDRLNKAVSFRKKEADRLFQENNFAAAIPIYLEEIRRSRKSDSAADCMAMLSYCYIKTDKPLEAMAIAWHLAEVFPKFSKTPGALLQVGEYLWNKNEFESALTLYKYYLENCPTDQHAGAISARVAKYYFDKASEAGKAARALPPGPEKIQKNAEARQAFMDAIPYYYNIIENFQHTDYGRSAFYLLGLCYFNAKEFLKAADAFLKFFEKESSQPREKIQFGDLADSKLRVAESYFQFANNTDKEIKALRDKLNQLGGADAKDKTQDQQQQGDAQASEQQQDSEDTPAAGTTETTELMPVDQIKNKINELEPLAKKYFNESITHATELLKMFEKGGLLENEKSQKALSAKENATALIGWAYDGLKEKEKAIDALGKFIAAYPQGKQTPAAMQRQGILYSEIGKFDESAKILESLATKFHDSREGKQAMPMLAKSMYEIGNYKKSIEVFSDMLQKKNEISIFDLRWALEKLPDCGKTYPPEGAVVALEAGKILLEKLEKPNIEEWLGKNRAAQIANDQKAIKNTMDILKEKTLIDMAKAAYYAQKFEESIQYLDKLLKNEKTPYFYDAKFLRADAYRALKNYTKALDDLGEIAFTANVAKNFGIYYKAQCLIGDINIAQEQYKQALAAFYLIAMTDVESWQKDEKIKALPIEERAMQIEWIEYSIYKAAICNAKLDNKTEKDKFKERYKQYFPKGKFVSEIDKL